MLRAEAPGLLPPGESVERLDVELIRSIARGALSEGVARESALALLEDRRVTTDGPLLHDLITQLESALEASPIPEREFPRLLRVYGHEGLEKLLGISAASLRRYTAGTRRVPDDVAARVHFLALVTADLAGSYNEFGLRRWWERPRTALQGRSPRKALGRDWDPDGTAARDVAALARALAGPGAAA